MTTESVWRRQFAELAAAVKPYTFESDGALFIAPECPEHLKRTYGQLLLAGYAKGWVK
jgi:hypothetical protein